MESEKAVSSSLDPLGQISKASSQLSSQLAELLSSQTSELVVDGGSRSTGGGISLLELKNHLLTSYLHNLTNLLIIRLSQTSHPSTLAFEKKELGEWSSSIVQQLVWLRLVFERLRPLEARLKYQIDKLLKTVLELDQHSFSNTAAEIDHVMNDPLSFKPNPAALEAPTDTQQDREGAQEESTSGAYEQQKEDRRSKEVYRPPRVAPVAYPEAPTKTKRIAPAPVALREHVSLATMAPLPESTTGLSNTAAKSSNRAKALARMNEYEEANMTRLFSTKKDAKRRRNDEAAVALGIETSAASKNHKRKLGALEGEFDGVLSEISRKSDRYSDHLGSSSKPHNKNKNSDHQFGSNRNNNNQKFKRKGAFDKALKKISK
ncbi:uncharacterized protein PGTG_10505 [Puccinia graminis f. sp. tritici CRL 75-36-700-3]|uniref:Uncharacterized protein n=1 Tax=Puccinia graminis f. sp. tritici (strain CRL 75-36-700-3 / race SCCL) TaxID=418459 RepID=E3KIK2_PUCGT|nr:uncharacterized protein PGTG_10505 [Puccinia graminis f. sp. tritici CRL 75-36-700-3]EFP84127.1 hypothetical protein PGTG_10505 [Puccinia graminis f. sp. tritici CRL 75-36-700-3]